MFPLTHQKHCIKNEKGNNPIDFWKTNLIMAIKETFQPHKKVDVLYQIQEKKIL